MTSDLRGDDEAFSAVLGAMIMLGIALVAFTTYQTTLAPSLEANSEADQMETAADRLADWAARTSLGSTQGATSQANVRLPLEAGGPPFAGSPSAATVSFETETDSVSLAARNLSVSHRNGSAVAGTDEAWQPVDGGSVEDVRAVSDLRLRVDEIDSDRVGENVTVTVRDSADDRVGDLTLSVRSPGGGQNGQGYELVVRTRDADQTVLYDQPILISSTTHDSHSSPISPYWVNLLNDDYRFDRVLGAAEPPFSVSLERDGLDADYTIDHERDAPENGATANDILLEGYRRSVTSGRLVFDGRADHADDQRLTVEHGAVVRSQADGAVFARAPAFSASTIGHTVHVSFVWPALTGSPDARSAHASIAVQATASDGYAIRGEATNLTVNVTTSAPGLWERRFAQRLTDAGLSADRGFATASGDAWARVDVWGLLDPDPSSDRYDLAVELRSVSTAVQVGN